MRQARKLIPFLCVFFGAAVAAQPAAEWTVVDYADLVDGRELSQSGESVSRLLEKLGGRTLPPPGQRGEDRRLHKLLDPLLEPYAFVLADVLDTIEPPHEQPLVEVGQLWRPGAGQPAWVELLRVRRFIVESDGTGTLRAVLPWTPTGDPGNVKSVAAAQQAWDRAWPVLRHVLAAERHRLGVPREEVTLDVRVYPYAHSAAQTRFLLGRVPHRVQVDDTRPRGDRPPLDLGRLRRFLKSGLTLEGGRLDPQGGLIPFGSDRGRPATILGRGLELSDLAVAYRAVAHGGLPDPAMSLDRGHSPWEAKVYYGGRLRDTSLGWVSLLCDVRFKTFSMGLGIEENRDLRAEIRAQVPSFKTHVERFAADPASAGVSAQQTRLWFYPDRVDLTVAPQSDVLALRHVRMSAASERLANETFAPGEGNEPPWTLATIAAINEHYDGLANVFPELADLDQVVRLLSFFTWLDQAARAGQLVPDLDALLAIDLPALPTPRTFPQMLSFNALPAAGSAAVVASFDRVPVVDALEMLNPEDGLLDPRVRLQRALAGLDRQVDEEAALLAEAARMDPASLGHDLLDLLAYRAQRLRMHRTVLGGFDPGQRARLEERAAGALRVISVGVGGLDLDMSKVIARATSRSMGLVGVGDGLPAAQRKATVNAVEVSAETRERWREGSRGLPRNVMPDHGIGDGGLHRAFRDGWIERTPGASGGGEDAGGTQRIVYGASGPEALARAVHFDGDGRPRRFERFERGRRWSYAFEGAANGVRAVRSDDATPAVASAVPETVELPEKLALLRIDPEGRSDPASPTVSLRLQAPAAEPLDATVPRWVVQRLILGREADLAHDPSLPGLAPLPPGFEDIESLMVLGREAVNHRPWEHAIAPLAGEQDPQRVAAAIDDWWDAPGALPAPGGTVVGIDWTTSPERWAAAPRPGSKALLVLPPDGFPHGTEDLAKRLADVWTAGRVSEKADPGSQALILLISAETPELFAARLRAIAAAPSMQGKLLAGWSLAGPVRADLAPWILQETSVAGVGIAEGSVVSRRAAVEQLARIARELASRGSTDRVESFAGPFLWHF
ncbi:MAG: hypothetical protein GTN89_06565 [Acidobacteria bacterium]|nr:hypothetical protein [Acidobacteriota bacterium]NIM62185.1 hypothetical protein [Acidobacteriota bacterium]NIO58979.1 hypothetical protein [Acidobacteriota bacterium]NIQ30025.1 hypothetical protein [Acidobacteriota bacterium]NIQ84791.1 hypothetical protein [Acidobacteriota bacterium]